MCKITKNCRQFEQLPLNRGEDWVTCSGLALLQKKDIVVGRNTAQALYLLWFSTLCVVEHYKESNLSK